MLGIKVGLFKQFINFLSLQGRMKSKVTPNQQLGDEVNKPIIKNLISFIFC